MTSCAVVWFVAITQTQSINAQGCPPNSAPVSEADNIVHCRCIAGYDNQGGVCMRVKETLANNPGNLTPFTVGVSAIRGDVTIENRDGSRLTSKNLAVGRVVRIDIGTRVITGSTGRLQVLLLDETVFTIGPNSDMVIDEFVYDPDLTPKKIMVKVSKGIFRWVTGKVAHKDPASMRVKIPVGTIGIRGTDFETSVEVDGSGFVILHFGQLEITENKTGSTCTLNAGYKITFNADGSVSRPIKAD